LGSAGEQLLCVARVRHGAGVAAQSVINARLGFLLGGPIWAAAALFVVGLVLLLLVTAATRQPAPVNVDLGGAPWWVWTGGAFGVTLLRWKAS
jgi:transporter family-2 protein